ncbi:MAG: glutathione-disulfide reductase [bacterium]|nr:glutathione-disulfide reductase [bacterium]
MNRYDYDLLTIGAGSGGVRAARMAATTGARVAIAEDRRLGGTCVNVGCVPKKLLVYAAQFGEAFDDAGGFGWSVGARHIDWRQLIANKDREIERLNGIYGKLLDDSGVTLYRGSARLLDRHTVEIEEKTYTAEHILVATGGRPSRLDIPGAELAITSDEAFALEELPESVLIAGGGYIAVEFAGIFNSLGSAVALHYRGPMFLRGFDADIRSTLAEEMKKRGIDLRFECCPDAIKRGTTGLKVHDSTGSTTDVDQILMAVGRVPRTAGIGLEEVGIELNTKGAVVVDAYSRTCVPNIYAVGDCTDRMNLTPVAIGEAMALVDTLFHNRPTAMDYSNIPTAVFSQPNIGTVGLTEEQARQNHTISVYRSTFRPMKHTMSGREEKTMMKLIVDSENDRVLGVHMVGPDAGEIVQGMAIALKCGATKAQFDATVGIHPTAAEEFVTMRDPI